MSVKLPTKHHLVFLSLKGACTGSSESTLVKMPHCWKSHVVTIIRVPTSSGNHGKPGKSLKKSMHGKSLKKSMHGKIMEFEKI